MKILFLLTVITLCVSCSKGNHKLPSNKVLADRTLKNMDTNSKENPPNIELLALPSVPGKVFAWQVADNQTELLIHGENLTVVDSIQIGTEVLRLSKNTGKTATTPIPTLAAKAIAPVWIYSGNTKFRMRHRYTTDLTDRPQVLDCTVGTDTVITKVNITIAENIFIYCMLSEETPNHPGPRSIYFGYNYVPFEDFIVFGRGKEIIIEIDKKYQHLIDTSTLFSIDYGDGIRIPTLKCS